MPPCIAGTLLKAVIFPPSRHRPPPSPFIHGKQQQHKPSRSCDSFPISGPVRISADARKTTNRIRITRNAFLIKVAAGGGKGWWTRPSYACVTLAAPGEGSRRWAGGGPGRGRSGSDKIGGGAAQSHVTGSIQQYRKEDRKAELDGGYQQQQEPQQLPPTRFITLPTALTLGRVASVPLLIITFYMNGWWATTATTGIFLAAAITDWLDGYIARKMSLRTAFGAFLDPVADKLMVATTLVLLCSRPLEVGIFGEVPWLLTVPSIAIIGREITMSAVREWAASQNSKVLEAVAVNNLGKWKTATQMTALTILLASRDTSLIWGTGILVPSGVVLLYISAGLGVWSLVVYVRKIQGILLK